MTVPVDSFPRSLLPLHRNTTGVLKVAQVLYALGLVSNRELYA